MKRRCVAVLLPVVASAMAWSASAAEPVTVGWIERIRLGTEGLVVSAKLDTGADNSSLHASEIRWIVRNDGDWVVFDVTADDGRKTRFESKVARVARIRRAGGSTQKRPVIHIGVCLAGVYRMTEVNLTDRTGLEYEFLVGRSFLKGQFLVDAARQYTVEPDCAKARAQ